MHAFAAALLLSLPPQEAKFSGPQKGEKTPGFAVFDVTARREADYVTEWKGAPTLLVFIHDFTRPALQLIRPLDEYAQIKQVRGLKALYVQLPEDRDEAERKAPTLIRATGLRSPLVLSLDGKEGPGAYGLNREVTLTVLVAKDNVVLANFALLSPNETDAPKVKAAIDEALKGVQVPLAGTPEELREEVLRLREEVAALRLELQRATAAGAARRPAEMERPREDERLVGMCRLLIQKTASAEEIEAAVKEIEAYIEGKDELRKQYVTLLARVLDLKYGNETGQAAMRRQLEKHRK